MAAGKTLMLMLMLLLMLMLMRERIALLLLLISGAGGTGTGTEIATDVHSKGWHLAMATDHVPVSGVLLLLLLYLLQQ